MSQAVDYLHVAPPPDERSPRPRQTLQGLLGVRLGPYDEVDEERRFVHSAVDDVRGGDGSVTSLALVVHELATNAIKHGALSSEDDTVTIDCRRDGDDMGVVWTELGGPGIPTPPCHEGFESNLTERTVRGAALRNDLAPLGRRRSQGRHRPAMGEPRILNPGRSKKARASVLS